MKYVYIATARIRFTDCFGLENTRDVRHVFSNILGAYEWTENKAMIVCDFINASSSPLLIPVNLYEYSVQNVYVDRVPLN